MKYTVSKKKNLIFWATTLLVLTSQVVLAQNSKPSNKNSKNSSPQSSAKSDKPAYTFGDVNRHSLGLGLGQTVLHGQIEDNGDNRISLDLYYNYSASHSFDLLINAHSSKHKISGREVLLRGVTFSFKGKLYQFDSFAPFLLGGLGFYNPEENRVVNGELVWTDSKWTFGTNFGAGAELKLNHHFGFGIMVHYHNPFDVKQDVGPEIEGSYTKVLLTSMYTF